MPGPRQLSAPPEHAACPVPTPAARGTRANVLLLNVPLLRFSVCEGGDVLVFVMEILKINGGKVDAITCEPSDLKGCNEKETAYVEKAKTKYGGDKAKLGAELDRLEKMAGKDMKPELQSWMARRKNILKKVGVHPPPQQHVALLRRS